MMKTPLVRVSPANDRSQRSADSLRPEWQRLDVPDANIALWPSWLSPHEADALQADLLAIVPWETHYI